MREKAYWYIKGGGPLLTDPPTRISVSRPKRKIRSHKNISNASLQRIMKLSYNTGADLDDGELEVWGFIRAAVTQ